MGFGISCSFGSSGLGIMIWPVEGGVQASPGYIGSDNYTIVVYLDGGTASFIQSAWFHICRIALACGSFSIFFMELSS